MGDHAVFFYGTLMVPGVLYRVIYGTRDPEPWQKALTQVRPALLTNHRRHRVKHVQYPAIVPCAGASVRGSICTGLTEGDLWRLDIFEGDDYFQEKVTVKVLKDDVGLTDLLDEDRLDDSVFEERVVTAYMWKSGRDRLEDTEWDFEDFRRTKMRKWTGEEAVDATTDDVDEEGDVDEGFRDVRRAVEEVGADVGVRGNGKREKSNGDLITANELNAYANT